MSVAISYEDFTVSAPTDPLDAATGLVRSGVFDRYMVYEKHGGFTVAGGVAAELVADREGIRLCWQGAERALPWDGRGLAAVADLLAGLPIGDWRAYGWAAFELSYLLAGQRDLAGPETLLHLVIPTAEVCFRPTSVSGRALDRTVRDQVLKTLREGVSAAEPAGRPRPVEVRGPSALEYEDAVAAAIREIREQRLQKVILSRVLPVDFDVDLVGTYVAGRRRNTPARSFLFDYGDLRGGGFCPEIVTEVSLGGQVTAQPLAGTRALSESAEESERLRAELLGDSKEICEHVISVRAVFDELRQVCVPETVRVHDFMEVKQRGSVQHLGSRLAGDMRSGRTAWDVFTALFPAITASGIPKQQALDVIRRMEAEPRGLYAGTVLTVGADGSMDAALVLRSFFQREGRTWLRAGAGIVEQSRPAREFEETCEKLRSVAGFLVEAQATTDSTGED